MRESDYCGDAGGKEVCGLLRSDRSGDAYRVRACVEGVKTAGTKGHALKNSARLSDVLVAAVVGDRTGAEVSCASRAARTVPCDKLAQKLLVTKTLSDRERIYVFRRVRGGAYEIGYRRHWGKLITYPFLCGTERAGGRVGACARSSACIWW